MTKCVCGWSSAAHWCLMVIPSTWSALSPHCQASHCVGLWEGPISWLKKNAETLQTDTRSSGRKTIDRIIGQYYEIHSSKYEHLLVIHVDQQYRWLAATDLYAGRRRRYVRRNFSYMQVVVCCNISAVEELVPGGIVCRINSSWPKNGPDKQSSIFHWLILLKR